MRRATLIFLITLLISNLNAQKLYLEVNKNYTNARIFEKNKPVLKVKNLKLPSDTILLYSITSNGNSMNMQKSTTDIRYVSIKTGTHALAYGLYGAGFSLSCALIAVLSSQSDPNYVDTGEENVGGIIAGFTAGGFIIGALIGACVPRWKAYNLPSKQTSFSYRLSPSVNKNYIGVGLVAKF